MKKKRKRKKINFSLFDLRENNKTRRIFLPIFLFFSQIRNKPLNWDHGGSMSFVVNMGVWLTFPLIDNGDNTWTVTASKT